MVSKAQAKLVMSSFDASFPEGIPSEQTTKYLLRMTAVSAPRRTTFTSLRNVSYRKKEYSH